VDIEKVNVQSDDVGVPWCSVDTRLGVLTVTLTEKNYMDCELYLDQILKNTIFWNQTLVQEEKFLIESVASISLTAPPEQRFHLGRWVLHSLMKSRTATRKKTPTEPSKHLGSSAILDFLPPLFLPADIVLSFSTDNPQQICPLLLFKEKATNLKNRTAALEAILPRWISDSVLRNALPIKDAIKIFFSLKSIDSSIIPEFPKGTENLSANRWIRMKKLASYVVEKLKLETNGLPPENIIKFIINGQVVDDNSTLLYIKTVICPKDMLINYAPRKFVLN
jgi:hypothetical protein